MAAYGSLRWRLWGLSCVTDRLTDAGIIDRNSPYFVISLIDGAFGLLFTLDIILLLLSFQQRTEPRWLPTDLGWFPVVLIALARDMVPSDAQAGVQ